MAKKKVSREITIKNPKIGTKYIFIFAGIPIVGILEEVNQKLSEYYKEKWYWFRVNSEKDSKSNIKSMRYPASIYDIIGIAAE